MASFTYNKTCEGCGTAFTSRRSNAKRCSLCRLYRDVRFMKKTTHQCWICDKWFAPLRKDDDTCAECQYQPKRYGTGTCKWCHEDKPRVAEDLDLCFNCAKLPSNRPALNRALAAKVQETAA